MSEGEQFLQQMETVVVSAKAVLKIGNDLKGWLRVVKYEIHKKRNTIVYSLWISLWISRTHADNYSYREEDQNARQQTHPKEWWRAAARTKHPIGIWAALHRWPVGNSSTGSKIILLSIKQ